MNAALYARVSSRDQRTIPDQLTDLRKYAELKGWSVALEVEEKESGARDTRPARYELIKQAWRGAVDVILVWKLDRWGRSIRDLVNTIYDLQEQGVAFVSLQDSIDLTTTNGKLMFHLLAAIAQWERETIVDRVRAGVKKARARGVAIGRPASTRIYTGKVRALHLEGLTNSEIARRCGISRASVLRILRRPPASPPGKQKPAKPRPCECPVHCRFCGARRRRDSTGHYCPTRNCQWQHGYSCCPVQS